jgi:hypothetical protein
MEYNEVLYADNLQLKVALRVATIIIEDSIKIPKDAPFIEKARSLTGYVEQEQMSFEDSMKALFDMPTKEKEIRLFDSQWMNIVNHAHCWEGYTKEDAIHAAVKMAEEKMAENIASRIWPDKRI